MGTAAHLGELEIRGNFGTDEVKKRVIQVHHCIYPTNDHPEQECRVRIRKCEHLLLTRLQWYCRKTVSVGFVKAIKIWLAINEDRGVDL